MNLNCAKTIGAAFRHGAGYDTLEVRDPLPLSRRVRAIAAVSANIPTEMAMKLVEQWQARGYAMDVVLYKKWPHSTWVDPHDDPKLAFGALPDRFPSVLSLDFRADEGQYEDEDNLYAMYLLRHLGRHAPEASMTDTRSCRSNPAPAPCPTPRPPGWHAAMRAIKARTCCAACRWACAVLPAFTGEADRPYDFTTPRP